MIERAILTNIVILILIVLWLVIRHLQLRRTNPALSVVRSTPSKPTLMYFSSDEGAPWGAQARYLGELEEEFGGRFSILRINTQHNPEIAARYGISSAPATLIMDEFGEIRHKSYGLTGVSRLSKQLEKVI
jgi:thioredoxin 1